MDNVRRTTVFRTIFFIIVRTWSTAIAFVKHFPARTEKLLEKLRIVWNSLDDDQRIYCRYALFVLIFFSAEMSGIMPGHHIVLDIDPSRFYDTVWSRIKQIFGAVV
jgi:hypothetical protein